MKMAEQNISGVKLERMRKDAARKMKIQWKLIPVCLILFIGLALVKNRFSLPPSANMDGATWQLRDLFRG